MSTRVCLTLPAYNEEATLGPCLDRLVPYCERALGGYDWHLLIVNNGSRDRTAAVVDALAEADDRVSALHLPAAGRGGALHAAARFGGNGNGLPPDDYLAYMDVDLSTDLEALPRLLAALDGGADVAVGSRHHSGSRVIRSLQRDALSRGYNALLRTVLGVRSFRDAQCGFKGVRLDRVGPLLDRVRDRSWFFDTELLVLAEFAGLRVAEVPVRWHEDPDSRVRVPRVVAENLLGVLRLKLTARRVPCAGTDA